MNSASTVGVVGRQTLVRWHKAQWRGLQLALRPHPQLLFQLYTFSTGGEGQGEGGEGTSKTLTLKVPQSAPREVYSGDRRPPLAEKPHFSPLEVYIRSGSAVIVLLASSRVALPAVTDFVFVS